jgi:hypothetical protein
VRFRVRRAELFGTRRRSRRPHLEPREEAANRQLPRPVSEHDPVSLNTATKIVETLKTFERTIRGRSLARTARCGTAVRYRTVFFATVRYRTARRGH